MTANQRQILALLVIPMAATDLAHLLGWPLLLSPVHVVFLELLIDPACSIAFEAEPEEPGILDRPPRRKGEPMFDRLNTFIGYRGIGLEVTDRA